MTSGLIVGNLDAEASWAHAAGAPRVPGLSLAARAVAAAGATLLRAFAADDHDRLALLAPVDPARLAEVPGLPLPRLEAIGSAAGSGARSLHWAMTERVAAPQPGRRDGGAWHDDDAPLHRQAWSWPRAPAAVACRAADRRFALETARVIGCALPGAAAVSSPDGLARVLAALGGPWVAKAPWSAAGRWRALGASADLDARRRAERLLARFGALVVEPWCARTLDVGVAALVTDEGTRLLAAHRLRVDAAGRFRGIEARGRFRDLDDVPGLRQAERELCHCTVAAVGRKLAGIGYRGPFGIDGWRWRDVDGSERFQALGEINPRLTFGLVTRALIDRLRDPLAIADSARVILRLGRGPVPPGGRPLFHPGGDPTAVWLEIAASGHGRPTGRSFESSGAMGRRLGTQGTVGNV